DGNKRTGSEERSDGRRRWVSRPTAMNNLPDSGDVVLGRPVDDRIGVWFDLARDVDEAICPGFGSRELDRERHVEFSEFAGEAASQRLDPVRRLVADTTERDEKSVDSGFELPGVETSPFAEIAWIRIRV